MNGVYWVPQVVGGTGFIVAGVMFMVEVQDKWYVSAPLCLLLLFTTNPVQPKVLFIWTDRPQRYKPAPNMLGWQVGFWNLIGGIGFTLCPAVGFGAKNSAALEYASGLSTFIGSWAFLVSHRHAPFSPPVVGRLADRLLVPLFRSARLFNGTSLWTNTQCLWTSLRHGSRPERRWCRLVKHAVTL
jgi:hypothetical protein